MRLCRCCNEEKNLDSFPKNKNCASGYESTCKECSYIKQQQWKLANVDQYKEAQRRWYDKNKQTVWANAKKYAKENPEWKADHCYKRRQRNRQASVAWDKELTDFIYMEARDLCKRRKLHTKISWHLDHIIPLHGTDVCGLHVWNNFAVIPAKLNIQKGNRNEGKDQINFTDY